MAVSIKICWFSELHV